MQMKRLCNFEPETRNEYFISAEMKKVWNIQLNMVERLKEVCKKYDLRFTLDSGSLLGAIRHKGFIPWDDDIDVEMSRTDYDKLVNVAAEEFKSPFFFQCAYTESGYYRGHAQLRYEGTTMIIPDEAYTGRTFNQGIFIDIFPTDSIPENIEERYLLCNEAAKILAVLWSRYYPITNIQSLYYRLFKYKEVSSTELYKRFENLFRSYPLESSKYCGHISLNLYNQKFLRNPKWYDDIIEVPFENVMMPIPAMYDEILKQQYGDYMKPAKTPSLHGKVIIDTEKSYLEYLPKLRMPKWKFLLYFFKSIAATIAHNLGYNRKK